MDGMVDIAFGPPNTRVEYYKHHEITTLIPYLNMLVHVRTGTKDEFFVVTDMKKDLWGAITQLTLFPVVTKQIFCPNVEFPCIYHTRYVPEWVSKGETVRVKPGTPPLIWTPSDFRFPERTVWADERQQKQTIQFISSKEQALNPF